MTFVRNGVPKKLIRLHLITKIISVYIILHSTSSFLPLYPLMNYLAEGKERFNSVEPLNIFFDGQTQLIKYQITK